MIDAGRNIGRVVELHGQRVRIFTGDDYIDAVVKGKVKYGDKDISPIAVGDYVRYSDGGGSSSAVESIETRKSYLSKPAVEKDGLLQVVVSNIDRLIIVTSLKNPKFKPGLVDRFLVIAFRANLRPVFVLNKIDRGSHESLMDYLDGWQAVSCDILFTSAVTGQGVEQLADIMREGTSVIAGHSGVGKSSLLNKISPQLELKTKGVSLSTDRGVHTTSRVSLYRIFPDGWVADTPGLKVIGLSGITAKNLRQYFPEFDNVRERCRFSDCVHIDEPGCAVKGSLGKGDGLISRFRYESYLKIYADIK